MDTFKGNFTFQEPAKEYSEPPKHITLLVGEYLLENGFALNSWGTRLEPEDEYQIYIHGEKPSRRKLFGLVPYQPLRRCLGFLYFGWKGDADEKHWTFYSLCGHNTPNNLLYALEQHFRVHISFLPEDYFLTSDG